VRVLARHPTGLLALEKPAGLVTHPNTAADRPHALLNAAYDLKMEAYQLASGARLFLLNRLDSPTSGIVLAADNAAIATHIKALLREHGDAIRKTYFALVKGGRLPLPNGIWHDRILTRRSGDLVRSKIGTGGFLSLTRFEWVRAANVGTTSLSLLRLAPQTGRTHQLRIQCANRGHPIIGDKTYGDFALNRRLAAQRLFLHAAALSVRFVWHGKTQTFAATSPLPDAFAQFGIELPAEQLVQFAPPLTPSTVNSQTV
jgi:23S rRNA-/tRNA-specific pseudouridylate synthase